jgi:hypothetical protein
VLTAGRSHTGSLATTGRGRSKLSGPSDVQPVQSERACPVCGLWLASSYPLVSPPITGPTAVLTRTPTAVLTRTKGTSDCTVEASLAHQATPRRTAVSPRPPRRSSQWQRARGTPYRLCGLGEPGRCLELVTPLFCPLYGPSGSRGHATRRYSLGTARRLSSRSSIVRRWRHARATGEGRLRTAPGRRLGHPSRISRQRPRLCAAQQWSSHRCPTCVVSYGRPGSCCTGPVETGSSDALHRSHNTARTFATSRRNPGHVEIGGSGQGALRFDGCRGWRRRASSTPLPLSSSPAAPGPRCSPGPCPHLRAGPRGPRAGCGSRPRPALQAAGSGPRAGCGSRPRPALQAAGSGVLLRTVRRDGTFAQV